MSTETNREYKDRLFKFIFGHHEHLDWTLSLYNAINKTSYTNTDDIEITTIQDAVYMRMKNDVSFLVDNIMNLYEQQSTYNPNMPMRFFIYAGMIYSKYIKQSEDYNEFSTSQQTAPTPRCICFYNGKSSKDDIKILKLSDTFAPNSNPDIEVKVTMININYGHNSELLEACKPLKEYSWFVDRVRITQKVTKDLEKAIDIVLDETPEEFLIKSFLVLNKAEVKRMCITEYNEEQTLNKIRKESKEEGFAEGRAEGKTEGMEIGALNTLVGLIKDGILSLTDAAKRANMTISEFETKTGLKA